MGSSNTPIISFLKFVTECVEHIPKMARIPVMFKFMIYLGPIMTQVLHTVMQICLYFQNTTSKSYNLTVFSSTEYNGV